MFNMFRDSLVNYRREVTLLDSRVNELTRKAGEIRSALEEDIKKELTKQAAHYNLIDRVEDIVKHTVYTTIKKAVAEQSKDIDIPKMIDEIMKELTSGEGFLDGLVSRLNRKQLNYGQDYSGRNY